MWLNRKLSFVLKKYFNDIEALDVHIRFYGKARGRLGSIRKKGDISIIRVNGALSSISVPDFVIDEVIAHELVHYIHGFGSNRERLYKYPHRGGVVEKELEKRGAGHLLRSSKSWLLSNWNDHLEIFLAK